ncbi:MAG: hypothetical protein AMXMBFR23_15580 [Chloroflexota bacterium]
MNFHVYLLRCRDGSYYVGHTDNLESRIAQHQQGLVPGWTRSRRPVTLLWSEAWATRDEAFRNERRLKGWSRAKKEALVRGDYAALVELARFRTSSDRGEAS